MQKDHDKDFILSGISMGFDIVNSAIIPDRVEVDNYNSATALSNKYKVEKQICEELEEGRYIYVKTKPRIVSALGAIDKSNGGIRIIHDCSKPDFKALNDYVTKCEPFSYQTVSDACRLINSGYFLAKVDLKSAYRSVPIHPSNYQFTGLKWQFTGDKFPRYMVDTRLMFGSRLAPSVFHRLSQAVRRIMFRKYNVHIVSYLDDFLIVAPTYNDCNRNLFRLLSLLRNLGFDIAWDKVISPSQNVTFLGINFNTVTMQMTLPDDKLRSLEDLIKHYLQAKRASRRELESLAGKLNYAAFLVLGGSTYLRRLLNFMQKLKRPHHKAKLTKEFYADLLWWAACLRIFNGKDIIARDRPIHVVGIDACQQGCGFVTRNDWGYCNWELDFPVAKHMHINFKEVLSFLFAVRRWAPAWQGARILVGTDSVVAKSIIQKNTCNNPMVLAALREIFWHAVYYDFCIDTFHIPGYLNEVPDAVSRLHTLGEAFRLKSLLSKYQIVECPLIYHMSYKSHIYLLQRWSRCWTGKLCTSGHIP